jgi:hypothetical protein
MIRVATAAVMCAAVLLSGCRLDGDVDVVVDGTGGGTVEFTVAADEELLRAAAAADVDPLAQLEQAGAALDGWDTARRNSDGGAAITLSTRFSDGTELQRVTTEFSRALAGPELAPLGPLRLAVTDDTVALDGTAGLEVTAQVSELGLTPDQAHEALAEAVDLRVVARMPGAILRSNADEQPDDTTVVWTVAAGERRTLEVASERPWSLARLVLVLGGPYGAAAVLAGALGIAGVVGYRWRRRRATLGATEPAAEDPGADEPAAAGAGAGSVSTGGSRTDAADGPGDDAGAEQHEPDHGAPGAASAAADGPGAAPAADDGPGAASAADDGAGEVQAGDAGAGAVPDDPDDDDPGDDAATIRPSRVRP